MRSTFNPAQRLIRYYQRCHPLEDPAAGLTQITRRVFIFLSALPPGRNRYPRRCHPVARPGTVLRLP
jgi:hypothetical protein